MIADITMQAVTLMKVYVKHKLFFYRVAAPGGVASPVPPDANLMDYAGQTLYMSEEVRRKFRLKGVSIIPLFYCRK